MKLKLIPVALVVGLVALAAPAAADTYDFDIKGQHAFIDFRIKHLGYSWLLGRFDKFNGSFDFDEKNSDASKVKVEIDVASINSNHAERDKHLRGPRHRQIPDRDV
jgi:polyisoprenoid-binding protein YceI